MLESFFRKIVFRRFLEIDLNAVEKATAEESLTSKYTRGTAESLLYGALMLPTLLFVNTSILSSVLIPITMVSGTAWFAVSLVNIKKKFEPFGNELTIDLYRAFITSLVFLGLMTLVALNFPLFAPITVLGNSYPILGRLSGITGTLLVLKMIYDTFLGATKYDMNDSMLTGQSEAAEKYFKRSLSLLNSCASHLKAGATAETAGYFAGLAFYEVFNYIIMARGEQPETRRLVEETEKLKATPPVTKREIAERCGQLVSEFLKSVRNLADVSTRKSYQNIMLELRAIQKNSNESQAVFNLRLATIFEEMEDMLTSQGEMLFKKRVEIERKFLVSKLPDLANIPSTDIKQGYLRLSKDEEERIRQSGDSYTKTVKLGSSADKREEIEEFIEEAEFQKL